MAYDFLSITNRVLKAFNEVLLDTTTFATVEGFHQHVKDSINASIRDIYVEEDYFWPFSLTETTQVLTIGLTGSIPSQIVPEYTLPADGAGADWDSFYIQRNDSLVDGAYKKLDKLDWDNYRTNYRTTDANALTGNFTKPRYVIRTPKDKIVVSPLSDNTYTICYDYFKKPDELVNDSDVPLIPEIYSQVIEDKALHYAYMFRDNIEQANLAQQRYTDGVNRMRRALIPQQDTMRSLNTF